MTEAEGDPAVVIDEDEWPPRCPHCDTELEIVVLGGSPSTEAERAADPHHLANVHAGLRCENEDCQKGAVASAGETATDGG